VDTISVEDDYAEPMLSKESYKIQIYRLNVDPLKWVRSTHTAGEEIGRMKGKELYLPKRYYEYHC